MFVGVIVGFLMYNFFLVKIFMGDVGSYFIGFCIVVVMLLVIYIEYYFKILYVIFVLVIVMVVLFYDMFSVILICF